MSDDAYSRWQRGARAHHFNPGEAAALAEHLMARHSAYRDKKHPDHEGISREVGELMARAYPGSVGPGGESSPAPAPIDSLLR